MRRLVHISDLHFGRTRPHLLEPLLEIIGTLSPHLVVLSGDLTQRARRHEFRAARAFLDRLPVVWIAVPGNHDVPLYNFARRVVTPYRNYRRAISVNLEPAYIDEEITVACINTVDPGSWQRGRIGRSAIARAARYFKSKTPERTRIIVVHHPFSHLPNEPKELMRGARAGIEALSEAGVDMVLSGHLHAWRADPVATRLDGAHTLQIQAGTGLSSRVRGEENDFNLLSIEPGFVRVDRFAALEGRDGFDQVASVSFRRTEGSWQICNRERNIELEQS
jgi:3',5'-cyclic AMP phosphodiesterase CpdA